MRKRLKLDYKFRQKYFKLETKLVLLKYLTTNVFVAQEQFSSQYTSQVFDAWKNKSFKLTQKQLKAKTNSKIRNYCIISGRGRGLSKNYFSLSRNSFKHIQTLGLLPGVYKSN